MMTRLRGAAVAALLTAVAAATAETAPGADVEAAAWDGNPLAWKVEAGCIRTTGGGGLLLRTGAAAAKTTVTARLAPETSGTNGWAVMAVAVAADDDNFWHLALVQCPPENGRPGNHWFELCEMRDGLWLAQNADGLKRTKRRLDGRWEYGGVYTATLTLEASGVSGDIRDANGKILFACAYAFPPPGADGRTRAVTHGVPALNANGGFAGVFSDLTIAAEGRAAAAPASAVPAYASDSFVPHVKERATGFFHVAPFADGRWWVIDPLGRGTFLRGVDHVKYQGMWSERTRRSIHLESNRRRFPNKADWEADAVAKLKGWGFNALGAGCDPALRHRGLAHAFTLQIGDNLCKGADADLFICPNERRPCSAFPNVFHPDFPAWCDWVARRRCAPNKDDPWLFGYFLDNELAWWGRGARDTGLFDAVAKLPDGHPAREVQKRLLAKRGVTGAVPAAVKLDFLRIAAERYFGVAAEAVRRHDPNHMVLGARFAGLRGADPIVWEIAGKYCDAVTFNCYPWADIDRGEVRMTRGADAPRAADAFAERFRTVRRPLIVTEWSFPALDTGRPCLHGAGQRFRTQDERTRATELFAKTMLSLPFIVGYNYFMWVDQPAAGISDPFPEDSNYGLLRETGEPHEQITAMFTALHRDIGAHRAAPPPKAARAAADAGAMTARRFLARFPKGGVTVETRNGATVARNAAGLELEWRVGAQTLLEHVRADGREAGTFSVLLSDYSDGRRWRGVQTVTAADWRTEDGRGVLTVTGEGRTGASAFRMTVRLTPLADRRAFLCDLARVENTGAVPLDVASFYFRTYAPYASDDKPFQKVPNLWKDADRDAWFAPDGTFFGGLTFAPTVATFRYFTQNNGRSQHPDAEFLPRRKLLLAPGAAYEPDGAVWMLAVCGTDGLDGWRATERW